MTRINISPKYVFFLKKTRTMKSCSTPGWTCRKLSADVLQVGTQTPILPPRNVRQCEMCSICASNLEWFYSRDALFWRFAGHGRCLSSLFFRLRVMRAAEIAALKFAMSLLEESWGFLTGKYHLGISINGGTPKWLVDNGKSY